jgi:DNA-binding protein
MTIHVAVAARRKPVITGVLVAAHQAQGTNQLRLVARGREGGPADR